MRRKLTITMSLALAFMALMPAQAANVTVTAVGFSFVPTAVVAGGSDTIVFENRSPFIPHTFTTNAAICASNDPFNPAPVPCNLFLLGPNPFAIETVRSGSLQLQAAPGSYVFTCTVHPIVMQGLLIVQ